MFAQWWKGIAENVSPRLSDAWLYVNLGGHIQSIAGSLMHIKMSKAAQTLAYYFVS